MNHGSCSNCAFFDNDKRTQTTAVHGLCRFNPPVTQPGPTEHGLWPVVSTTDWCGHFSPSGAGQTAAE